MQELNSIRDGKHWNPVLVRKAREEEMQYHKKHAVYEKVPMSQCWKETAHQDRLGVSECPNR